MTSFTFTEKPRRAYGTVPGPTPDQIARAAEILAKAERPLIFARENARVAANATALAEFAEKFAIPVIEYRSLANSLPTDHPMLLAFDPGPHMKEADAILVIETDVPWIPTVHGDPAEGCKVIHIGVDPLFSRIPIRSFPCDLAVTGAPRIVLPQLARGARRPRQRNRDGAAARPREGGARPHARRRRGGARQGAHDGADPAGLGVLLHRQGQGRRRDPGQRIFAAAAPGDVHQAADLSRHADGGRARLGRRRGDRRQARGARQARHRDPGRRRLHVRQSDRRPPGGAHAGPADPVHHLQQQRCGKRSRARRCASSPTATPRAPTACRSAISAPPRITST